MFPWRQSVYSALQAFFRLRILAPSPDPPRARHSQTRCPDPLEPHCMSFQDLWSAVILIEACEEELGPHIATDWGGLAPQDIAKDRKLADRQGSPGRQWRHILRIVQMRVRRDTASPGAGGAPANATLELVRTARVTDERDKVYGILSVPSVAHMNMTSITPNYGLGAPQIFTMFTEHLLQNGSLEALRLVYSPVGGVRLRWV